MVSQDPFEIALAWVLAELKKALVDADVDDAGLLPLLQAYPRYMASEVNLPKKTPVQDHTRRRQTRKVKPKVERGGSVEHGGLEMDLVDILVHSAVVVTQNAPSSGLEGSIGRSIGGTVRDVACCSS